MSKCRAIAAELTVWLFSPCKITTWKCTKLAIYGFILEIILIHAMVSLAGFRLLQDASKQIYFKDLDNLWHALQDPDTVEQCNDQDGRLIKVHLRRPFGQGVRDIAESDNTDQQRTRLTAEYCFRIYAAVMYGMGEAGGDEPWKNERSLVWREDRTCPALLNVKNLPKNSRVNVRKGNGLKEYPRVLLGEQTWLKDGKKCKTPIQLRLHRFACWLGEGEPPHRQTGTQAMALHECGNESCLNPACFRWGDAGSNRQHRMEHEKTTWRSRR